MSSVADAGAREERAELGRRGLLRLLEPLASPQGPAGKPSTPESDLPFAAEDLFTELDDILTDGGWDGSSPIESIGKQANSASSSSQADPTTACTSGGSSRAP